MLFLDDKECPVCAGIEVYLNTWDLLECPQCNLMYSLSDPLAATILKERGQGKFVFEHMGVNLQRSRLLCPSSLEAPVLPDYGNSFQSTSDIENYLDKKSNSVSDQNYDLWFKFQNETIEQLMNLPKEVVEEAWSSKTDRTYFYKNNLLPSVAKSLKLIHGNEEFTVDYVMSKLFYGEVYVPQVQIESENDIKTAKQEINKLCRLNSPLRVLLTVFDGWDGSHNSNVFRYLREWQQIIKAHGSLNSEHFLGVVGILIGSYSEHELKFYSVAFWSNGDLRQPLQLLGSVNLK